MSIHAEKLYKREDGSVVRVECFLELPWGSRHRYDMRIWRREKHKRTERYAHSAATNEEKQEVALMAWESIKPNFLEEKP